MPKVDGAPRDVGEAWRILAARVVQQACDEYVAELKKLRRLHLTDSRKKRELEGFFDSEWCSLLSPVDCDLLAQECRRKAYGRG